MAVCEVDEGIKNMTLLKFFIFDTGVTIFNAPAGIVTTGV
jgi:hypothetical protein